ncbi:MAG: hypothetical protein GY829_12190, partial [Gammaproteobacteria bacterium]|nr:hypothetical protein [Gammaproteobacteria bacterium]
MVPWWGYLYIGVLGLLTFAGIIEELKKFGGQLYALGTFLSLVIIVLFVFGYFKADLSGLIGLYSIPMLLFVIIYDFYLSGRDLSIGSKTFMQANEDIKSRMELSTATIIVAPGYLAGV